jgi:FAD/FMN-containing dehydrogenase
MTPTTPATSPVAGHPAPRGPLGVITEITVRLRPLRTTTPRTVVGFLDSLAAAGDAASRVTAAGIKPSIFELVDRVCLHAVNQWKRVGLPENAAALLPAQTDLPEPAAEQVARAIRDQFVAAGATEAMISTDAVEADALLDSRRLAYYPALEQLGQAVLTVTGEHGVGLLKRAGAAKELGPAVVAMQRAVKAALDPQNILNPGKVI